jgi:hypothetical protein
MSTVPYSSVENSVMYRQLIVSRMLVAALASLGLAADTVAVRSKA